MREMENMELEIKILLQCNKRVYEILVQQEILEKICRCQEKVMEERRTELTGEEVLSSRDDKGIKRFASKIWFPNVVELKDEIVNEAHKSRYSIHPEVRDVPRR